MTKIRTLSMVLAALAVAACDACSGGKVTIQSAPVVQWDGGSDDAAHACAILSAAKCHEGQDVNLCAATLRNDQAQGVGGMFSTGCIVDAGPSPSALRACGVTCADETGSAR